MSIRTAREVVVQADFLRSRGDIYRDSLSLAQAYGELSQWQFMYSDEYARICYYYGRQLRAKDDPVNAMKVFINATHCHTHDYLILGRIYSNIASVCHLANSLTLSYNMYEQAGKLFLQGGDTLAYCYAINDMAFELAEQGKKTESLALLANIESQCNETYLLGKIWETKADAYLSTQQYDSAIYCVEQSNQCGNHESTCTMIKAQAFAKLEEIDSALIYANIILSEHQTDYQNRFNALYIITHFDSTLCAEEINTYSSKREDIRYYEYEPEKEKLSQAISLLEHDLNKRLDLRWLYAIIVTLISISILMGIYVRQKRKKHQLLSQKISDLEMMEKETLSQRRNKIEAQCTLLKASTRITKDLYWRDFEQLCQIIDQQFYLFASQLRNMKGLNETETRLCILVLIGFNEKSISQILPYALNSVGKLKYRVSQKLGISAKNLRKYLITITIGEIKK